MVFVLPEDKPSFIGRQFGEGFGKGREQGRSSRRIGEILGPREQPVGQDEIMREILSDPRITAGDRDRVLKTLSDKEMATSSEKKNQFGLDKRVNLIRKNVEDKKKNYLLQFTTLDPFGQRTLSVSGDKAGEVTDAVSEMDRQGKAAIIYEFQSAGQPIPADLAAELFQEGGNTGFGQQQQQKPVFDANDPAHRAAIQDIVKKSGLDPKDPEQAKQINLLIKEVFD